MTDRCEPNPAALSSTTTASWLIAVLLSVTYTFSYLDRQVLSLLIQPIKESLDLSDTQIGVMQGISFSLFYVAASLPIAWVADRSRPSRVMSACVTFWSVMTMLCGLATSFWQLMLCRIGVAVGEAGLPPAALATLSDRFDPRRLATATSMFMLAPFIGGGLALMGGGALYGAIEGWERAPGTLFGRFEDWQLVFLIIGAPGLIVAVLLLLLIKDKAGVGRPSGSPQGFSEVFRFFVQEWKFAALYGMAMAVTMTLLSSYVTWLPAAIMRSKGVDEQTVGMLFGPIYLFSGAAGTLSAGILIMMRGGRDPVGAVLRYMRGVTILLWPIATLGLLTDSFWAELVMMGVALFLISSITSLSSLPFQYVTPRRLRAQGIALLAMLAALFGTGLGPILAGVMSDHFTFAEHPLSVALAVIAGVSVPIVFLLLTVVAMQHKRRRLDLLAA